MKETKLSDIKVHLSFLFEGTLVNLIENISYHRTTLEALDHFLIDLLAYVFENLIWVYKNGVKTEGNEKILYDISMSCLSIFRYVTDHIKYLPLSITQYILNEKDFVMILIEILEREPWKYESKGKISIRENNDFRELLPEENEKVFKEQG